MDCSKGMRVQTEMRRGRMRGLGVGQPEGRRLSRGWLVLLRLGTDETEWKKHVFSRLRRFYTSGPAHLGICSWDELSSWSKGLVCLYLLEQLF